MNNSIQTSLSIWEIPQSVCKPPPTFYFLSLSLYPPSSPLSYVFHFPLPFNVFSNLFHSLSLLFFFLHCFSTPPPPPSVSHSSTESHSIQSHPSLLGRHMRCFDRSGYRRSERKESSNPCDSKDTLSPGKHIRPSITEAHPAPLTLWVRATVTAVKLDDPPSLQRC